MVAIPNQPYLEEWRGFYGISLPIAAAADTAEETKPTHVLIRAYCNEFTEAIAYELRTKAMYDQLLDALRTAGRACGWEE